MWKRVVSHVHVFGHLCMVAEPSCVLRRGFALELCHDGYVGRTTGAVGTDCTRLGTHCRQRKTGLRVWMFFCLLFWCALPRHSNFLFFQKITTVLFCKFMLSHSRAVSFPSLVTMILIRCLFVSALSDPQRLAHSCARPSHVYPARPNLFFVNY